MNNALLLIISVFANLCSSVIRKFVTNRYESNAAARQLYAMVTSAVSALVLLALADSLKVSPFTVILALFFGIVTATQAIFNLQALECGPFSYTTVIISLSMLIPTLSGAIFWNESIALIQIVGIVLMVGCFVFSVNTGGEQKKASFKWLVYCAVAFICTGLIGIMQKVHQSSAYKDELDAFLIIAFAFSCVYSTVRWIILTVKNGSIRFPVEEGKKTVLHWKPLLMIAFAGCCVAANNKLNLFLSGVMDSAVFFPVVNGAGLILASLAAFLLFRERLTKRQWIGLVLGIAAVLCLCNPFG